MSLVALRQKLLVFFFFGLTKYLASVFMVLWLGKAPFNSLFYGYTYSKQIVIFYNNLWGLRSNLHVWMPMHACMNDCSWHENCLLVVTSSIWKKKALYWFKQEQQPSLVVNNNKMCFGRGCYPFYGNLWLQHVRELSWTSTMAVKPNYEKVFVFLFGIV